MKARFVVPLLTLFLLTGCSSAPKQAVELFTLRNNAESQLELANREADRGNYEGALELWTEARRLAVASDDPALLVRTDLSRGNIFFYQGLTTEAAEAWNAALTEAERAGNGELAAISRIYISRGKMLGRGANAGASSTDMAELITQVNRDMAAIKTDTLSVALGWTVIGLAEKESRHWAAAETAIKKALDIHVKGTALEQAAYDWYLIASVRSVAGDYQAALDALTEALGYDRRAENTQGLGMDWKAMGDVYTKMGNTTEAAAAHSRSAEILRSIGLKSAGLKSAGLKSAGLKSAD
ncbi:hypothetical protein FACS1894142_7250 [Spirochaetia bacterium]|nr:hypothetical protein FACS1894142_7250 [Spirochaetia bacterium]